MWERWALAPAALYLKARDRWIGWSHAARQCHLQKVVANSRFVIVGGVRVKNLASKVLALAQKRLPEDWAQAYGYKPLLLETYVEARRFAATSYRAANWLHVGKTCSQGRRVRTIERINRSRTFISTRWCPTVRSDCARSRVRRVVRPQCCTKPAKLRGNGPNRSLAMCGCATGVIESGCLLVARDFYAQPGADLSQACRAAPKPKRLIDCLSTRL